MTNTQDGAAGDAATAAALPAVGPGAAARPSLRTRAAGVTLLLLIACLTTAPGWLLAGRTAGSLPAVAQLTSRIAEYLRHGQVPLWDDQQGLGQPLLGGGEVSALYPGTLVYMLLPARWAWAVSPVLHLWLAGVAAWLLAGRSGLRPAGRLLAGSTFMLCAPCVLGLNQVQGNVIAWLPWAVLAVERLIEKPSAGRLLVATLVFAVQFLGGSVAASAAVVLACLAVWLVRLIWSSAGRALCAGPLSVFAMLIGLAVAGVVWLPLVESMQPGGRGAATWGARLVAGGGLALVFIGTIPLLLAAAAIVLNWRHRATLGWFLVAVVTFDACLLLMCGGSLVRRWPSVQLIQDPVLLAGLALALAMLAGLGLEALTAADWGLVRVATWQRRLLWASALTGLVALGIALTLWLAHGPAAIFTRSGARLLGPPLMLLSAAAAMRRVGQRPDGSAAPGRRVGRVWLALGLLNLLVFPIVHHWGSGRQAGALAVADAGTTTQPVDARLPGVLAGMPPAWIVGRTEMLPTRAAALERLKNDSKLNPREVVLLDQETPESTDSASGSWWQLSGATVRGQVEYLPQSADEVLLRVQGSSSGAWLVVAGAYDPGWHATLYQQELPVSRAYGMLRAVKLPGGSGDVLLQYRPAGLRLGLFASAGGALMLLLIVGMSMLKTDGTERTPS